MREKLLDALSRKEKRDSGRRRSRGIERKEKEGTKKKDKCRRRRRETRVIEKKRRRSKELYIQIF